MRAMYGLFFILLCCTEVFGVFSEICTGFNTILAFLYVFFRKRLKSTELLIEKEVALFCFSQY